MTKSSPSIFSRIVAREIPATIVAESDDLIAFEDVNPQARVHVLVVPKTERFATVSELADSDPQLLARLVAMAQTIADERADGQYRLIFNSGAGAGQTIFHVHAHVIAGDLGEGTLVGH